MLRRFLIAGAALALLASSGTPTGAWGYDIHRVITDRAIAELPAQLRPFYEKHRTYLVEHSIDPDLWRLAGFGDEPPRHYVDLDVYGTYPFSALPRNRDLAVAKFGRDHVEKYGTLPWRVEEMYEQLVKAFRQQKDGTGTYALENIKFFSSVLAHYVSDAHVPFHAVLNYDGQLTNQHGIHARFETELFLRYRNRLRLVPPRVAPVNRPVDFVFDRLLEGFREVEGLLRADGAAIGDGDVYDDAYFDRFFAAARPVLERQMSAAIAGVAATIVGAWEKGGRPELPLDPVRPIRKKRPPVSP